MKDEEKNTRSFLDDTMTKMVLPSLQNLPRSTLRRDISQYRPRKNVERVVICGAGPTLEEAISNGFFEESDFVVANQGSLLPLFMQGETPDVCMIVDPTYDAVKPLWLGESTGFRCPVFAATTTMWSRDTSEDFFFKNALYNPEGDIRKEVFNQIVDFADAKVTTFVLQVGCVVNASALIAHELMDTKVLPTVPIVFVGVDAGEVNGRWRCTVYEKEEKPEELGELVATERAAPPESQWIEDEYGYTTMALKEYKEQLEFIVRQMPEYEWYVERAGRLSEFMEVWK